MPTERQEKILEILKSDSRKSVSHLSKILYVSEMTVRRDLKELEAEGYVERYHGGAVYKSDRARLPVKARDVLHIADKDMISSKIERYLSDDMTVFIDSSSTCSYIVPLIAKYRNIKIVTNSVFSLLKASEYHIPCVLTGGEYWERDMCLVGGGAENFFEGLNIDIGFFSSAGIADDGTVSDLDERQTAVRRATLKHVGRKIFVFSADKVGRRCLYTFCTTDIADDVILLGQEKASER